MASRIGRIHISRCVSTRKITFKRFLTTKVTELSDENENLPKTVTIIPQVQELTKPENHQADMEVSLLGHLKSRHLVEGLTSDDLYQLTEPGSTTKFGLYCGADPTAKSLHLGNLLPLIVLLHFRLRGHNVTGLVGGATGVVGDPSGRTTERNQMATDERLSNVQRIQDQIIRFLNRGVEYARSRNYPVNESGSINSVNNASWWENVKFLDFLATYGRHIRVSSMLGRDSIQSRLSSSNGLGFNEFTYQVLQAYDFWHLFKEHEVNIQIGGNDQWGNITAGIDLISRLQRQDKKSKGLPAYGITVPLLTTPSGEKFGKSAGNAVFISDELTKPFQLYQYFINTPDEIVGKLLKIFTLLPINVIDNEVLAKHESDPSYRIAQRVLAREVVDLIHGNGVGEEMAYITNFLFPTPDQPFDDNISADKLIENFKRSGILARLKFDDFPDITDLKMSTLLSKILKSSKSETKTLIKQGGVYLGLERDQFEDPDDVVLFDPENHLIDGKLLLVRTGKQNYHVVEFSK